MMYVPLILFFTSLIAIIIMMSRKLFLLKIGQIPAEQYIPFEVPHLEKVKHLTIKNLKKYEHIFLVEILRLYVRSTNFVKNKYQDIKTKIKNRATKNGIVHDQKEISKFLKIIGDYKQKIRDIKHKIHREDNLE